MDGRLRILNISYDRMLLQTRSAILRVAGHAVRSARTFGRAVKLLECCPFDLVVIGHSIPSGDIHRLVVTAHGNNTPVLLMVRGTERPETEADSVFVAADGPLAFLRAISSLLHPKNPKTVASTHCSAVGAA